MAKPCIICVAITGSLPRKFDNPAVPVTVAERIESAQQAFDAGATIVHAHVRDDNQNPTSDPERFARVTEGFETHFPGMIIQFSTGGRTASGKDRGAMLALKPDMAPLAVGSNNSLPATTRTRPTSSTGSRRKCGPIASSRKSRRSTSATFSRPPR